MNAVIAPARTVFAAILAFAALATSAFAAAQDRPAPYDRPIIIAHADLMVHLRKLTEAAPLDVSPQERAYIDELRRWAIAERERADQLRVLDRRYDTASGTSKTEISQSLRRTAIERRYAYGKLIDILQRADERAMGAEGRARVAAARAIFQENERDRSDPFPF